jgi:hypothetical protein
MGRGAFALAMLAPALGFGQATGGEPTGSLALRWSDASGISPTSASDFEGRLAERLGRPAFDAVGTSGRTLSVNWHGSPEQCRVELQLLREGRVEGTRELKSPNGDCKSLAPALLTVSALLIEASDPEPTAAADPEEAPVAAPSAPTQESEPPAVPPPSRSRVPFALLSVGAQLGSGLAPRLELGPAAALVFAPLRHLRVGASGAFFVPHEYGTRPGFELGHASGSLLACAMPITGSLGLGVCGSGTVHRFTSTGTSLPHPKASQTFTWSAGLSARAEWRLVRSLWWVAAVGADVTSQPLFFYFQPALGSDTILFEQRRLAPLLFLGLTLELP